ncbi:unnamed protein product [Bursaphelenchus okinawaensis]|uniref:Actin-related protein 6 n=1 Tax=Bursaphelenchus okinawaensis TaxID=465554 RepID=A0A811K6C1_9BILA|nr:unnamed protein product [Bursaphelenchus okinawaensis]CAG9093071.1 unnamed protein product [Bursaphelenchus okinawaensis]
MKTLVVDNGAASIRANFSGADNPIVIPNTIYKFRSEKRRVFVADEIEDYNDKTKVYYSLAHEKGYLVNWNVEYEVWDRLFGPDKLNVDFEDTRLLLTDINSIVPAFKDNVEEIVFESYQFNALNKTAAANLVAQHSLTQRNKQSCIVVDSGFSFTHILPYYDGGLISNSIVRLDIGGKALTNQLKEWISYRQLEVRDETYIMNQCKEDLCFVSTDFNKDMKVAELRYSEGNTVMRDYLLPDFVNFDKGEAALPSREPTDRQKIVVNTERFTVPELLFNPSDVGLKQAGIPEAVAQCITEVAVSFPDIALGLPSNIICVGGNAAIPGFVNRLQNDLQQWCTHGTDLVCTKPESPTRYAWDCGRDLVRKKDTMIEDGFISQSDYFEHGDAIFYRKMGNNFFSY